MCQRDDKHIMVYIKGAVGGYKLFTSQAWRDFLATASEIEDSCAEADKVVIVCKKGAFAFALKQGKMHFIRVEAQEYYFSGITANKEHYLAVSSKFVVKLTPSKGFELNSESLLSDGYLLKQIPFINKGIRSLTPYTNYGF